MGNEVCAAIADAARIWLGQPHNLVEKRCFPGTVVTYQRRYLPGYKPHTNIVIRTGFAE